MNVITQCKEALDFSNENITHVSVPASYVPGITLFSLAESQLFEEILKSSEIITSII